MAARNELEILLKAKADTDAAFGQAIKGIRSIETETEKATKKSSGFMKGLEDSINNMGGSWLKAGVGFAAGTKAFELIADTALAAAKSIGVLANKAEGWANTAAATGLGVVQVQRLQAYMEDAGFSAGDLESSMRKMQTEIAKGGDAMAAFGIDVRKFQDLKPEDQLRAMAQAIIDIENPTSRAAAAVAAFGKGGAKQLAALAGIAEGLDKTMDAFSEAEVRHLTEIDAALDKAGRSWENWKKRATYSILQAGEALINFRGLASIYAAPPASRGATGSWGDAAVAAPPTPIMTAAQRKAAGDAAIAEAKRVATEKEKIEKFLYDSKLRAMRDWIKADEEGEKFRMKMGAQAADFLITQIKREAEARKWAADQLADEAERSRSLAENEAAELERAHQQHLQNMAAIGSQIAAFGEQVGGAFGRIVSDGGRAVETFFRMKQAVSDTEKAMVALGAAQQAFAGGSVMGGAAQGAAAGTAIMPGWGTAIGAVVGGVLGWLGGKKKTAEALRQLDTARNKFIALAGGIDVVKERAELAGISIDEMLATENVDFFNSKMKELQDAFALQDEAAQGLNDAMEKYGITISELGPAFAQQKLDEQFGQLFKDWELLSAAGVDHLVLIDKMGPAINEYANMAIAAGATIPEAMRPIIQQMIDQGLLLDANGQAYKDLESTGLTFAESMTQATQRLIDKIEDLVNALLGIPNVHRTVTVDTPGGSGEPPSGEHGGEAEDPRAARGAVILPFRRMGSGGVVHARPGGTAVVMGEGGHAELAAPVAALADRIGRAAAAAAGGGVTHLHVYIGGDKLDNVITKRVRGGFIQR